MGQMGESKIKNIAIKETAQMVGSHQSILHHLQLKKIKIVGVNYL